MKKSVLNKAKKEFIKQNYLLLSGGDIAKHLGCSKYVVNKYKRDNNLVVPAAITSKFRSKKLKGTTSFTAEMDAYLKQYYLTIPTKRIAKNIAKSGTAVRLRMQQLNLVIPPEIILKFKQDSRFKKGHVSHNKGVSIDKWMNKTQKENFLKTSFKKGNTPHNTKQPGYERLTKDGYIEVRVKEGGFVLKNRLVWINNFGPIPEGNVIVFKDGNSKNLDPNNLECISKAENMKRNSIANYPPELISAIKLTKQLINQL